MFGHSFDIDFGFVLRVLGDLEIVHRDGTVVIQLLRALQLCARQRFICHGLAVIREASGDIVAPNAQQQLSLLDGVAQPRVNRGHTSCCQ